MIVVAYTSVILNLCRVQHEHLLQRLFTRVLVPNEVATEFRRLSETKPRFLGLTLPVWIETLASSDSFPSEVLRAGLDLGESAAIALCLAQGAGALLIDESLGREVATRLGMRTIGLLGVLIEAHRCGIISGVATILERLEKEAGFWIAHPLRGRVLREVNE